MKRFRWMGTMALAGVVAFGLTACGNDDDATTDTTAAPVETEAPVDTEAPAETTVDTEAPAETAAPDTAATDTTAAGAATGTGTCQSGLKLGFFGALTGDNANLGINIKNGAVLAIEQHNTANPDCTVELVDFDSQGSPDQAPALAQSAVGDASVVGIIGPAFSGESKAANPIFDEAGLPIITPSATNPDLSKQNWKIFHRALAGDDKQGPAVAKLMQQKGATFGVIDDASEYGKGLADIVRSTLGDKVVASTAVDPKAADFSAAVTAMKDKSPEVIFYGGYYAEAGKLAKQLRDGGVTSVLVFGDGVLDKGYVESGGPAAEGSLITCTCAPATANADFLNAYKAKFNADPATYGAEAYDSANAFLAAIKGGNSTREAINTFLSTYDAAGVTKQLKWDATGEVAGEAVYSYEVKAGAIAPIGLIQ